MSSLLLPSLFLYIFGLFNLLGINVSFFKSQLLFGFIGIAIYIFLRRLGPHFFRINSYFFYLIFVALLILTYIIGVEIKGSKRWIDLYFFSFQASEFLKVFFMIYLADFFTRNRKRLFELPIFLKSLFLFILPAFIIFKQPDLGNAIVFTAIFFVITFFSGVPKKNILKILLVAILIIPLGWFLLYDYQRDRIMSFLNPSQDTAGSSYNMIQAVIAVGSGKFTGRGLGGGTQSSLSFLPENHTDFAFSSLIEQFGFIGGFFIIFLYVIITLMTIKKIIRWHYEKSDEGKFKFLLYLGFLSYFITQVFINIGMNLGIMPITGITLPLISYGGSSLLTWIMVLALIP